MAIKSGFFNSVNGDRRYLADFFALFFGTLIGNGVFPNPSTGLQVLANQNMTVTIKPGKGWINGYFFVNDSDYNLTIDNADGVLNRIDRVVLQLNFLNREIVPMIKKGTFASTPLAPTLKRDVDAYEIALADVYVGKGVLSITQANITDLRLNTELCGIVHGLVDQVDTTSIFNQYQSWYQSFTANKQTEIAGWQTAQEQEFNNWQAQEKSDFDTWKEQEQADFDVWFQSIQDVLSGDVAANLSNRISTLEQSFNAHQAEKVHEGELHGFRLIDGKLEYYDGQEWQRVRGDGYPVGAVTNFQAKSDNQKAILTWTDPDDVTIEDSNGNIITIARWKGTKILRKTGSYPANENDGVLIVDSGVRNQYQTNGFVDTGLTNDVTYYYSAFPYTTEDVFDTKTDVSVVPTEQRIYGVRIDKNNSNPETRVTYIGDSIGFSPMRGNNGNFDWGSWQQVFNDLEIKPVVLQNKVVKYYLNPNDFTKKADGTTANLTGTDGDVMIEFGKSLWYKWTDEGTTYTIEVSDKVFDGAVKHAFEIEDGYNLVPYYPLLLTQILFVIFFKSTDSQTALGRGYVDVNSTYISTGNTNSKGMFFGETTGKQQMKFLGIEDYYGNKFWWIDGLVTDASFNLLIGKGSFNDGGSGYTSHSSGVSANTGGYINSVQGGNDKGFIIKSASGSETTYYADYGNLSSSRVARFGSYHSSGSYAGFASLYLNSSAADSDAAIGARLFCASNGKIYIGAYLGTTLSGKLRSISGTSEPAGTKTIGTFRTEAKANN